jgi:DNA invertase Pin-like site-specific DNA recombinase
MVTTAGGQTLAYLRVSTDGQADSGLGLEAQETRVRGFAAAYGYTVDRLLIDTASGKSLARPAVQQLLAAVRGGHVIRVVVAKLDRLTRSTRDLQHLLELFEQQGVALVSVAETLDTQTAAGRLVLNVMAAVASWEREAIGERTREALAAKRQRGQRTGNLPFGYQLDVDGQTLIAHPDEQRVLDLMMQQRAAGATLTAIADHLNSQGYRTRRGGSWHYQNVQQLLAPPATRRRWRLAAEARRARRALVA